MSFLALRAYIKLMQFDLYLAKGNFSALYNKVRNYPLARKSPRPDAVERIAQQQTWRAFGTGKKHFAFSAPQP